MAHMQTALYIPVSGRRVNRAGPPSSRRRADCQHANRLRNLSRCNVSPRSRPVSISMGYAGPPSYSRWPE